MRNITEKIQLETTPPFPSIVWWQNAVQNKEINIQEDTLYNKSQPQNRYYLTGSQGVQLMSIPIKGGRNQRTKLKDILISYDFDWQSHHWKTIKTLYERSPFFEYFAAELSSLFSEECIYLLDWNKKSIEMVNQLAQLHLEIKYALALNKDKEQERNFKEVIYHQVFEDKTGFIPNCSILDLLFCEGNNVQQKLSLPIGF